MSVSVRAALALSALAIGFGAARASSPSPSPSPSPALSPGGPPFVAWLEPAGPGRTTLVVVPTRALEGDFVIAAGTPSRLPPQGGRLPLPPRVTRVEVQWRDPAGLAGARAVIELAPPRAPASPRFERIAPSAVTPDGPSIDQAVRIR